MSWLPVVIFSTCCAALSLVVAFALIRWAISWSVLSRTLVAAASSLVLIVLLVGAATRGDFGLLVSLGPDEFLEPFTVQILANIALALPIAWLISRRHVDRAALHLEIFE